jgi:hypothetical protein
METRQPIKQNKPSRSFGDFHAKQRFTPLAEFSAFGDETKPIKVHVRTANHSNEPLSGPD